MAVLARAHATMGQKAFSRRPAHLASSAGLSFKASRPSMVVRAEGSNSDPKPLVNEQPVVEVASSSSPSGVAIPVGGPTSFSDAMAFTNAAGPEIINGRLAMVGVLAAIGAELATGESVFQQFTSATPIVLATWALLSVASLVPLLKGGSKDKAWGPFNSRAERYNGWAAMIGVGALVLLELIKGQALF